MTSNALHSDNFGSRLANLVAKSVVNLGDHPHHHTGCLLCLLIVRSGINRYNAFLIRRRAGHLDVAMIAAHTKSHVEPLHHLDNLLPRPVFR